METFVQTFSDLIRDRLSELKLNAFSAENAAGLPPDAIRNVLRSEKLAGPTLARTKEICDALGLEIRIAPKREMAELDASVSYRSNDDGSAPPTGFVTIPWAEPKVGAGSAPVCFSRRWLEDRALRVDFLQAAIPDRVDIDCAFDGETIALLDSGTARRSGHGVWCYRTKGKVLISRITFHGMVTIIHRADLNQEPQVIEGTLGNEISVLGKVVWLGQSIPFKGSLS